MNTLRARFIAFLVGALGATAAQAWPGDRIDRHPFFASTMFAGLDDKPSIAADLQGDTVVVWADLDAFRGIWGRRFAPNGEPRGEQFRVGLQIPALQRYEAPVVAMDADGNFVVAWFAGGFGLAPTEILAQRFNSDGVPQGNAFTVISTASRGAPALGEPHIAMNATGDFVIVWSARENGTGGVAGFAQRYNRLGVPQGNLIRVNQRAETPLFASPAIAMDAEGNFAVVWLQMQNGIQGAVQGRFFTADGETLGDERTLATPGTGFIFNVVATMDARGALLVAFDRSENTGPFGSESVGIFARLFGPHGHPRGKEFLVSRPERVQFRGEISADQDSRGNFVITWIANESPKGGSSFLHMRLFHKSGHALTTARRFDFPELGFSPRQSAVAMDGRGNFTVVWQMGTPNPDGGQGPNILGQRFAGPMDDRTACAHFIATKVGTRRADIIRGTAGDDVIHAGGGNDIVFGGGGDDVICGGAGDDQLFGEDDDDLLRGGTGDDVLDGGPGSDVCNGGDAVNGDTTMQCE